MKAAVPAAADCAQFFGEQQPDFSLGVAEDAAYTDVAQAVVLDEALQLDALQGAALQRVAVQAVHEGADPDFGTADSR